MKFEDAAMDVCPIIDHHTDDITTCPVCFDRFANPRLLPCQHTFCMQCIEKLAHVRLPDQVLEITCPLCRATVAMPHGDIASSLPVNVFACRLVELVDKIERHDAVLTVITSHEANTSKAFCRKTPLNSSITSQTDVTSDVTTVSGCMRHGGKPFEVYCAEPECSIPICLVCAVVDHNTHRCVELTRPRTELAEVRSRTRSQLSSMRQLHLKLTRCLEFTDSAAQRTRSEIEQRFAAVIKAVEQMQKELLDSVESFRARGTEFNRLRVKKVREEIERLEDALRLHDELWVDDDCAKIADYMTNIKQTNTTEIENELVEHSTVNYVDIKFVPVSLEMDRVTDSLLDTRRNVLGEISLVQLTPSPGNNSSCRLSIEEQSNDIVRNNDNSPKTTDSLITPCSTTSIRPMILIGTAPSHGRATEIRRSSFESSIASAMNLENERELTNGTLLCERRSIMHGYHGNQSKKQVHNKKGRQNSEKHSEVPPETQLKDGPASATVGNPVRDRCRRTCLAYETDEDIRAESKYAQVVDESMSLTETSSNSKMNNELWSEEVLSQQGVVIYRFESVEGQSDADLFIALCLKHFGFAPQIEMWQTRRLVNRRYPTPLIVGGVARPVPLLIVFSTKQEADRVVRSYRRYKSSFAGRIVAHLSRYHIQSSTK